MQVADTRRQHLSRVKTSPFPIENNGKGKKSTLEDVVASGDAICMLSRGTRNGRREPSQTSFLFFISIRYNKERKHDGWYVLSSRSSLHSFTGYRRHYRQNSSIWFQGKREKEEPNDELSVGPVS
jgi:hypothetical protein